MVIREATARQIVEAVEAVYLIGQQKSPVCSESVASFMEVQKKRAVAALENAVLLDLLMVSDAGSSREYYVGGDPLCRYLVQSSQGEKRTMFRVRLEEFAPYKLYKSRRIAGEESRHAAQQVCTVAGIRSLGAPELADLFETWGMWSGSLTRKDDGATLAEIDFESLSALTSLLTSLQRERDAVVHFLVVEIGEVNFHKLPEDCREALIDAVIAFSSGNEAGSIIRSLANAVEAFLIWVASRSPAVELKGASSIISYAETLKAAGRISARHLGSAHLIGQIRAAADHADGEEEGRTWRIRRESAREAIHVAIGMILSIMRYMGGVLEI